MIKHTKAIRNLIQNADKGILAAQFQLHENYSKGKYVEQNDKYSRKYLKLLENSILDTKLCVNSLQLTNFRRFQDLNITFDKKITVIIGDNGSGKTSIVDSLAKLFSWFNNNLEKGGVVGKPIISTDINVNSIDYSEINCKFSLNNINLFDVSLSKTIDGYPDKKTSEVDEVKRLASIYRKTSKNKGTIIPLLAFYSVERSNFTLNMTIPEKMSIDGIKNRYAALKNALEGSGKLEDFSKLYIELVNLAEGEESKEVKNLREQIVNLQKTIEEVYHGTVPPKEDPFLEKLNNKKEELEELRLLKHSSKLQNHLNFVNKAIETIVPDVKNLTIDRSLGKPRILVDNLGNTVNIAQLSQGQKMLVALAGDLARRLVTLNPDLDEPLNGHGIVVIDEIELHLHPRWQQEILIGLQKTFPNLQFIVSTHSPQVLSTVDKNCIRQICIDHSGNPIINTPTFQTKGVTSADIMARIMGTNSVPENIEEAAWLDDFYNYLQADNKSAVDSTLIKIRKHFGDKHPVVVDCESRIRISEMRARLGKG